MLASFAVLVIFGQGLSLANPVQRAAYVAEDARSTSPAQLHDVNQLLHKFHPPYSSPTTMKSLHARTLVDGDCSPLKLRYNTTHVQPDTPGAFVSFKQWRDEATSAPVPDGFDEKFKNLNAIPTDFQGYPVGVQAIQHYEPEMCAKICRENFDGRCKSFAIMVERVPSIKLNRRDCPNAAGVSAYTCSFFADTLDSEPAQWSFMIADFEVVFAGVNYYEQKAPESRKDTYPALTKRDCDGAPVIINPGFEMDDPAQAQFPTGWSILDIFGPVTLGFTKPGSTHNGGTYALKGDLLTKPAGMNNDSQDGWTGFFMVQALNTCPGQEYQFSVDYRWDDSASDCSIAWGVGKTVSDLLFLATAPSNASKDGAWSNIQGSWTSEAPDEPLWGAAGCRNLTESNHISFDNVNVTPF